MDGLVYNEKPYEQMDDLGVPLFLETPIFFRIFRFLLKLKLVVISSWK